MRRLWIEAEHARRRINQKVALDGAVIFAAITTAIGGGDGLQKLLKDLAGDG